MIQPLNDVLKVETSHDEFGFGGDEKEGAESGVVVAAPEFLPFFGYNSFAFEGSLGNMENYSNVVDLYKNLVGKRVYWSQYKERGSVIRDGDKTFAFVKMTDLIAWSEPDQDAENVTIKNGGAFNPGTMRS